MNPNKVLEVSKNVFKRTIKFGKDIGPANVFFFSVMAVGMVSL